MVEAEACGVLNYVTVEHLTRPMSYRMVLRDLAISLAAPNAYSKAIITGTALAGKLSLLTRYLLQEATNITLRDLDNSV